MIERITTQYAIHMVKAGVVPKADEAIVRYGLEIIITSISGVSILALVSIITYQPFAWVPFIIGFAPIRTTAGGYHSTTKSMCYIITTLVFMCALGVANFLQIPSFLFPFVAGLSLLILLFLSPVEASNKPLHQVQRRRNRRASIVIALINQIISFLCRCIGTSGMMWVLYFSGILAASTSLVVAKLVNKAERSERK